MKSKNKRQIKVCLTLSDQINGHQIVNGFDMFCDFYWFHVIEDIYQMDFTGAVARYH